MKKNVGSSAPLVYKFTKLLKRDNETTIKVIYGGENNFVICSFTKTKSNITTENH